jgi:hypothetical protein
MAAKVFVSAGTPADESQRTLRDGVVTALEAAGLTPRVMSDRDWDYKNPLRGIRHAMAECSGAIVIAYPRYQFPSGLELRKDGARPLTEVAFPTAWNQIEAAMAYERGLPLLVVARVGLRKDALLESTHDIRPFWIDSVEVQRAEGFLGYLGSWKRDVEAFAAASREAEDRTARKTSLKQLFALIANLEWHDGIAFVIMISTALWSAYTLGKSMAN